MTHTRRRAFALGLLASSMSCGENAVDARPVTELRFVDQPAELVAGQPFDVSVELVGGDGARTSEAGRRVTLTLANGSQLSGPVVVSSSSGVARFDDLVITSIGQALRMVGTSGEITATSTPFVVRVAPVNAARSSFSPESIIFVPGTPTAITFKFTDSYGNPVAGQPVSIASSLAGSTLSPASGATTESGVFVTTFSATATGKATLTATIGGTAVTFGGHLAATEFCAPLGLTVPGIAAGLLPIATCDLLGRPAAVYRFMKSVGGGVAFSVVPSGFTARVEVKTSLAEPSVAIQPTVSIPSGEWLLPDGQYMYRISAVSPTATGSYSITSTEINGTSGLTTRFIATPGTYTGQSLALADRQFGDGTVYDYFVLFSNRSCTITMRSTAFDAFLWIDDAVELVGVDGNDNAPGGTDARVVMNPCNHNGNPIGILTNSTVGPNGSARVGPYTLIVEYGPPVPAFLGAPPRVASFRTDTMQRDLSDMIRIKRRAAVRR